MFSMLVTLIHEAHVRGFHDHTGLELLIAFSSFIPDPQIVLVVITE